MHPIILLLVFVVATVVGYLIIKQVPSLLHTPLMSGMNALVRDHAAWCADCRWLYFFCHIAG